MLVVIGIVIVLVGILMPSLNKAWKSAIRASVSNDLQAIATALEAYRQDFGDYPRVATDPGVVGVYPKVVDLPSSPGATVTPGAVLPRPNPMLGTQVLCFALMGPAAATDPYSPGATDRRIQDGADGPGFRGRAGGKIYPAYLPVERFKMGDPTFDFGPFPQPQYALEFSILDRWNLPILYFPASLARPNVSVTPTPPTCAPYVDSKLANPTITTSETSRYDGDDNLRWFTDGPRDTNASGTIYINYPVPTSNVPKALARLRAMLGDRHGATAGSAVDGIIQSDETPVDLPFLLWSAGPDERFGPFTFSASGVLTAADLNYLRDCDDITNFPRK